MRTGRQVGVPSELEVFLSIQAQDFIEETSLPDLPIDRRMTFLSIQAQDFIEEERIVNGGFEDGIKFLSIQAQDFIEEP